MYYFVVFFRVTRFILGLYTRFICTLVYMICCSLSSKNVINYTYVPEGFSQNGQHEKLVENQQNTTT